MRASLCNVCRVFACWSVCVVRCLSSVVCRFGLFGVRCVGSLCVVAGWLVVRCSISLCVVRRSLSIVCCSSAVFVVRFFLFPWLLFVVCCLLLVGRRVFVICCLKFVVRW